jgi:hypothetical protein
MSRCERLGCAALIGLALALTGGPALAVPVSRSFTVTIVSGAAGGPFEGQSYAGSIEYDDQSGMVDPDSPSIVLFALTSFNFVGFFGQTFTLATLSAPPGSLNRYQGTDFIEARWSNGDVSDFQLFQFDPAQNAGHPFRYFTQANGSGGPFGNGFVGDVELPEPTNGAAVALAVLARLGQRHRKTALRRSTRLSSRRWVAF